MDETNTGTSASNHTNINEYLNSEIQISELLESIKKQKTSAKSPDLDSIHPLILDHFPTSTNMVLLWIFNECCSTGNWIWNTSEVIFIRKLGKSSYSYAGAYRPLALASYIGKILERIIDVRL